MRTNLLRKSAVALGLGIIGASVPVQAQTPYSAPARWNNFRPVSEKMNTVGGVQMNAAGTAKNGNEYSVENLPAPVPQAAPKSDPQSVVSPSYSTPTPAGAGCAPCQSDPYSSYSASPHNGGVSPYSSAASAPWEGTSYSESPCSSGACGSNAAARPALFPYFGGANLLFLTLAEGNGRYVASGLGSDFTTSLVDPGYSTGFDIYAGRYLGCGKYGLGFGYFLWNPGNETVIRQGAAGSIRAAMPEYRDVSLNFGTAAPVYDQIDGTSVDTLGATAVRMQRDVQFQGIEANLFGFGLMGAQRAAYGGCGNNSIFGNGLGLGSGRGFGGAMGPLVRASSGRLRMTTSQGFRWFQIKDSMELAYNIDGTAGYQAEDIYDNIDVENNLYGYQFGSTLSYCFGSRLGINLGGKFGVYGNNVEVQHRLGTETQVAYLNGDNTQLIDTDSSDTVLSTLGELDLGLGYRISNAWTVTGGYRVMGITGVATAVDSYPQNYSSVAASSVVHASDSYLLHGAYCGLQFNW